MRWARRALHCSPPVNRHAGVLRNGTGPARAGCLPGNSGDSPGIHSHRRFIRRITGTLGQTVVSQHSEQRRCCRALRLALRTLTYCYAVLFAADSRHAGCLFGTALGAVPAGDAERRSATRAASLRPTAHPDLLVTRIGPAIVGRVPAAGCCSMEIIELAKMK